MKKRKGFAANLAVGALIVYALIALACIYGWFHNLYDIVVMVSDHAFNIEFIIRIIGVPVLPLGVIMGIFA